MIVRHFARYREIARVLVRNGLFSLVKHLGPARWLSMFDLLSPLSAKEARALPVEVRLRISLEELGPAFIKLGQVLSTRPDVLPASFISELRKLQDSVTPVDGSEVLKAIEAELGKPASALFERFNLEAVASASIGQVHEAVLRDGRQVIIKVKKPGVDERIQADLEILKWQANFLERHASWAKEHRLSEIAREFERVLKGELDYTFEARNMDRFARNFENHPSVKIPAVYWDLTTRNILTMEKIRGIRVADVHLLDEVGIDKKRVAEIGTEMYMKMFFEDGFFHADPHPGNLVVVDQDTIGLLDFGMVGIMSREMRSWASELFLSVMNRDAYRVVDVFFKMEAVSEETDEKALARDINDLFLRYHDIRLKQFRMADLLSELVRVAVRHRVRLPAELLFFLKTLLELESLGELLDPDFNLIDVAKRYSSEVVMKSVVPDGIGVEAIADLKEALERLRTLPAQIARIVERVEKEKFKLNLGVSGLSEMSDALRRTIDQLALSILIASFVLGSAFIVVQARLVPRYVLILAVPVLVPALLLGIWLVISILRRRS